ncbi:DUF551 domain-containing protein [Xenorhabdus sp. SF857]|uniref:DUF551 domain-containing protein n=1 Tax=Xenorhabdus bakwenae TaxID=3026967 RepID=UPI002557E36F|nr:DUF551 domain-containing protein [Xenorhabdus sp. SF857]WFQ80947.1 DUF551 domain-containing protein [Xenorhabdus sp. SF857]
MEWIKCSDRLPENGTHCLVFTPDSDEENSRIDFEYYDYDFWHFHSDNYEHFMMVGGTAAVPDCVCVGPSEVAPYTHWMPLPEIPKGE